MNRLNQTQASSWSIGSTVKKFVALRSALLSEFYIEVVQSPKGLDDGIHISQNKGKWSYPESVIERNTSEIRELHADSRSRDAGSTEYSTTSPDTKFEGALCVCHLRVYK